MTDEDRIGDILIAWENDFEQGKDVPTIPKPTRRLLLGLHVNRTLTSSSESTGFATFQCLDTDDPTVSPSPAAKPSDQNANMAPKSQGNKDSSPSAVSSTCTLTTLPHIFRQT
jgi:hypothetical protein